MVTPEAEAIVPGNIMSTSTRQLRQVSKAALNKVVIVDDTTSKYNMVNTNRQDMLNTQDANDSIVAGANNWRRTKVLEALR